MPEAASSVAAWSTEQMILEMVQVCIATVVTRVVWTAVVLRCGKQMEKLPHYHFSWIVSFQKQRYHICEMLPLETVLDIKILFLYSLLQVISCWIYPEHFLHPRPHHIFSSSDCCLKIFSINVKWITMCGKSVLYILFCFVLSCFVLFLSPRPECNVRVRNLNLIHVIFMTPSQYI